MRKKSAPSINRRSFVKGAVASAGTVMITRPDIAFGTAANSKVEIGVIGCGGRGGMIAGMFRDSKVAQVVAVHDYFEDRAKNIGDAHGVPANRRFTGLDGYKEMLNGTIDAAVITSPPCFHPEQAAAALGAGKHVYVAKPVAVDVPGCTLFTDAAKAHAGKLTTWVDFQTRANEFYQGAARHIKEGMIGNAVTAQVHYISDRLGLKNKPGTDPVSRLRNWVFDIPLSGDIIVEQNVHVLDVANWFLGNNPIKAVGDGGRKARIDVGDCYDHFAATYWYPNDVLASFNSTQCTSGFSDLCVRVYGSLGTVDSHYGGIVNIRGKKDGYRGGDTASIYRDGAIANIDLFTKAVLSNTPINNAEVSTNSVLTGILGREAAYSGRILTWDQMIKENRKLDLKLDDLPANGPSIARVL